jgi:predicted kinase
VNELPVAILMSGAPGSGKSTLAVLLGQRLRLPVIDKDTLRRATLWSIGVDDMKEAPWGPGLWYSAMEAHLSAGVSVIGDMTLFRGVSEPDVAARLAPLARLAQVHCRCEEPIERFIARTQADPLQRRHLDDLVPLVTDLAVELKEPLELDCPTLEVDTTHGYEPSLDDLAETILARFAPHLRVLLEDDELLP